MLSYLDHIAPLCAVMQIPLLCDNLWMQTLAELYYPSLSVILDEGKGYCLDETLKNYDVLFTVNPSRKANGSFQFFDYLYRGKARSVCSFHGQSDKKQTLFWLEQFADEDIVLAYGPYMMDFFQDKGVLARIPQVIHCGNYRYEYYKKHQPFFDALVAPHLFPENGKKTLLYAPTWTHPNQKSEWRIEYSCFFQAYRFVLDTIPDDYQVLVKLHPLLVHYYPNEVETLIATYETNEKIRFLNDIPLVYPILAKADLYLGDFSSVGYDFLAFNRPLFFLSEEKQGLHLYKAGTSLDSQRYGALYSQLEKKDDKRSQREEMYAYAFGETKELSVLKSEIEASYA